LTTSLFGWLDHSEAQRRQMLEIVDFFRDKGTLDELGFGSIRDAFSDHFFPGTSTLQTRARYLLFVPWIYLRIERDRVPYTQVDRRARSDHGMLARALQRGGAGENEGVIGIVAGDAIQRTPAAIYWTGLKRFHIWQFSGSMAQYYATVQKSGPVAAPVYSDDGELFERTRVRGWHAGVPPEPQGFLDSASMALTSDEATYIRERITLAAPSSLFTLCINGSRAIKNIEFPWLHPDLHAFPKQLQSELEHARRFSIASYGAALLYNLLLTEKASGAGLPIAQDADKLRDRITATADERAQLKGWRMTDFWEAVIGKGHGISRPTREFVEGIVAIFEQNPGGYADDATARQLIERRELALKGGLARLTHRRALEKVNGPVGLYTQTYRWPNVQRIVADIRTGLARKDPAELSLHA
jgi:hypothetical protein